MQSGVPRVNLHNNLLKDFFLISANTQIFYISYLVETLENGNILQTNSENTATEDEFEQSSSASDGPYLKNEINTLLLQEETFQRGYELAMKMDEDKSNTLLFTLQTILEPREGSESNAAQSELQNLKVAQDEFILLN